METCFFEHDQASFNTLLLEPQRELEDRLRSTHSSGVRRCRRGHHLPQGLYGSTTERHELRGQGARTFVDQPARAAPQPRVS